MAQLSTRGAVDLGALATARQNEQRAAEALASAPEGVVVDVTTASFQADVIDRSMTVPVVIDLWATWCGPCKQLSPILERLAAEAGGRWVLAKVDVDAEPQIGAAFQVQSIPSVFAVIKGQPVPLFQGAVPEAQVRAVIDEVLRVAAEQGVAGSVAAQALDGDVAEGEPVESPLDPRFEAAYTAVEAGDWAAAEQAYRAVLATTPQDPDGLAGVAFVGIARRVDAADETGPLAEADAAALAGDWERAFALGIAAVRAAAGDEKDKARARVLDYFAVAGDDPAVAPARRALASALF